MPESHFSKAPPAMSAILGHGGGEVRRLDRAAGGIGGVDKNVLSVNGVARAMIGAHETLSVANPNLTLGANTRVAPRAPSSFTVQQTVHVDARNSVNPEGFARQILTEANTYAVNVGRAAVGQSLRASPGVLRNYDALEG